MLVISNALEKSVGAADFSDGRIQATGWEARLWMQSTGAPAGKMNRAGCCPSCRIGQIMRVYVRKKKGGYCIVHSKAPEPRISVMVESKQQASQPDSGCRVLGPRRAKRTEQVVACLIVLDRECVCMCK